MAKLHTATCRMDKHDVCMYLYTYNECKWKCMKWSISKQSFYMCRYLANYVVTSGERSCYLAVHLTTELSFFLSICLSIRETVKLYLTIYLSVIYSTIRDCLLTSCPAPLYGHANIFATATRHNLHLAHTKRFCQCFWRWHAHLASDCSVLKRGIPTKPLQPKPKPHDPEP